MKKIVVKEHHISSLVIIFSIVMGIIYGVYNGNDDITKPLNSNLPFIQMVLNIFIHNISIFLLIIFLSIFFYIGPIIPVATTFFVFGDGFAILVKNKGIIEAINTYPHFIPEALAIMIALSIAFMISNKILNVVFKNETIKKGNIRILNNAIISILLLFIAAIIESIKLSFLK